MPGVKFSSRIYLHRLLVHSFHQFPVYCISHRNFEAAIGRIWQSKYTHKYIYLVYKRVSCQGIARIYFYKISYLSLQCHARNSPEYRRCGGRTFGVSERLRPQHGRRVNYPGANVFECLVEMTVSNGRGRVRVRR